jgi:hypothetical protein
MPDTGNSEEGNNMPSASNRSTPSRQGSSTTKDKGTVPAMKNSRPDRTAAREPDARGTDDRDGNESHAKSVGAKGKPARSGR